jgi:REP element-mobilizing transposase RayT
MRLPRIKSEGPGFYHCISRVIERRFILQDREKEVFCALMRKTEAFCGVRILTYSVLSNHFHVLVYVPEREDLSDAELISHTKNAPHAALLQTGENPILKRADFDRWIAVIEVMSGLPAMLCAPDGTSGRS